MKELPILESIFLFSIVISILIFVFGMFVRSPSFIALSAVFFILTGTMIATEGGIQTSIPSDINAWHVTYGNNTAQIDRNFVVLTTSNDNLTNAFHLLFMYGGIALLVIALAFYYAQIRSGKSEETDTEQYG